jgi:aminoacrylate hydrolase
MAADALAVLDGLGIEHAHLIGHSTGGCIGQVLAIEHPARLLSLVASSSWTAADPYFRRLFEVRKLALDKGGPDAYVRAGTLFQYPPGWISQNIAAIESAEKAILSTFPPVEVVLAKIEAILRFDRTAQLGCINVPTLVTTAMDDLICPPYFSRALAEAIPGARLQIIPEGGHFCPRSQPLDYYRNVEPFLRSLGKDQKSIGSGPWASLLSS